MHKVTVKEIFKRKGKKPIACLTAYSKPLAEILDNHYKGKEDYSQLIFRLLMTEIWFNTFIDKN